MDDVLTIEKLQILKCKNCLNEIENIEAEAIMAYCEYCESYVFVIKEKKQDFPQKIRAKKTPP